MCATSSSIRSLLYNLDGRLYNLDSCLYNFTKILAGVNASRENPLIKYFPLIKWEKCQYKLITAKGIIDKIEINYNIKDRIDKEITSEDRLETLSRVIEFVYSKTNKDAPVNRVGFCNTWLKPFVTDVYNDLILPEKERGFPLILEERGRFSLIQKKPKKQKEVRFKENAELIEFDIATGNVTPPAIRKGKPEFPTLPLHDVIKGKPGKLPVNLDNLMRVTLNENMLNGPFKIIVQAIHKLPKNKELLQNISFGIQEVFHGTLNEMAAELERNSSLKLCKAIKYFKLLFENAIDRYFLLPVEKLTLFNGRFYRIEMKEEEDEIDAWDYMRFRALNFSDHEINTLSFFLDDPNVDSPHLTPEQNANRKRAQTIMQTILMNFFCQVKYSRNFA